MPIAHLMPHDPRGTEPCVTVHERDGGTPTFVVKAAGGAPGTELTCNRAPAKYLDFGDDERKSTTRGRMTDAEALARGEKNPGNAMTQQLKFYVKLGRQTGVHVSPSAYVNGLFADTSSGWSESEWHAFFDAARGK